MTDSKSYLVHLFVILLLSLQLIACGEKPAQQASKPVIRPPKIALVSSADGDNIRQFPATVEPTVDAQLAFRVNGELAKIYVVAGQEVKQGDMLAELDDKDFRLSVKQAKAKYDLAVSQYQRAKQLYADKLVASSVYDEAKAQLDIAEAQLDGAQTNLKYTKVTAPFSGTVAQLHVEAYEFIQAKQPIMELQGRDTIDVAIQVPEQLMAQIPKAEEQSNYQPSLVFDAKPDRIYKVRLKEHDITPNPATKSYKVVFSMPTPQDINILSGMTGKLLAEMDKVLNKNEHFFLVPVESVFVPNQTAESKQHFVYKLDKANKTQLVRVEVHKITQRGAEVLPEDLGTLKIGDRIVAAGSHFLTEGQQVRPWEQERCL